jgi:hypothetical protein
MSRQRMSYEDAVQHVTSELNLRPDKKMAHRDLIAALDAKGKGQAADQIPHMIARGALVSSVDLVVAGRPAASITLPSGG